MAGSFFGSKFDNPGNSPGFLLWQVSHAWQRAQCAALAPLDLTHVQFVLLAGVGWLQQGNELVTQAKLSRHAGTDPMMTSQVVRHLERQELLVREQQQDRRKREKLTNQRIDEETKRLDEARKAKSSK